MKRLLIFLLFGIIVFALTCLPCSQIFNNDKIIKVVLVSKSEIQELNPLQNGNTYLYSMSPQEAKTVYNTLTTDGVVLYFDNTTLNEIANYYNINYFQGGQVEDYKIYYGYTPIYKSSVVVNNKKVNTQIAITDNKIVLGFPMILTGY